MRPKLVRVHSAVTIRISAGEAKEQEDRGAYDTVADQSAVTNRFAGDQICSSGKLKEGNEKQAGRKLQATGRIQEGQRGRGGHGENDGKSVE